MLHIWKQMHLVDTWKILHLEALDSICHLLVQVVKVSKSLLRIGWSAAEFMSVNYVCSHLQIGITDYECW